MLTLSVACSGDDPKPTASDMGVSDMAGMADMGDLGASDMGQEDMFTPGPDVVVTSGEVTLTVSPAARSMTLARAGEAVLVFPFDGVQLGRAETINDQANYDPYSLKRPLLGAPAPLDKWLVVERVESASAAGVTLVFEEGVRATVAISPATSARVQLVIKPERAVEEKIGFVRLMPVVDPSEGFYGLGEWFDSVNQRGFVRAMQLEVDPELESGYNEAHVPIPMLLGTRGWGIFVEDPHPAVFDVASEVDDRVDIIFGLGMDAGQGLKVHLFAEAQPLDLTRHYYEVTGFPGLPARWGLGPVIWRDENEDQAQVISDAETMRALDLAASAYWIDRPYATAVNTFDFSADMFDDPQAMIDRLHALGFRMALWHTPYLDDDDVATAAQRMVATEQGYYPLQHGIRLNQWGTMLDLTNPDAKAWWQDQIRKYTSMGVEGFKLDYGEDVVPGLVGRRNVWRFHDGSDERTMHALFQNFYHATYAEVLAEAAPNGYFMICRASTYGDQVRAPIIWPGDLDANMLYHGEEGTARDGSTYKAVGGLPAALIGGLTLGPSGFPFYGSDTGGYRHSPPDRETFTRWFQQTAWSPVMQIGTSSNDVAWEFNDTNGFDEEMLGWYREATRLHLRLFPYLWSYAERLATDGRAIQRPLGLAHPELNAHPNDTYLLGDHLLVAPVVRRAQRARDVILPAGEWLGWHDGARVEGGQTLSVDAPLSTIPVYLRAGGIVPMLRPTIDTMAPTTVPAEVDSYATTPGMLYHVIGVGSADHTGSFSLFDGAQVTLAGTATTLTLTTRDGQEFNQGAVLELVGITQAPQEVTLDGQPLTRAESPEALEQATQGWRWEAAPRPALWIKVPAGERTIAVTR